MSAKNFLKALIVLVVILFLSPIIGFWIAALAGVAMVILPIGAFIVRIFPKLTKTIFGETNAR